jgi:hypothetical protein
MGKRIAACFGLNYAGRPLELRGCVNDAKTMQTILDKNGFKTSMYVTNESTTRLKILSVLFNLAMSTWSDQTITSVWIYYAGHGTQIPDVDGDESDRLDEAIVPSDCQSAGCIGDDQLYRVLQCFNPKCVVSLFFDCCHSGSICDLPYSYTTNGQRAPTNGQRAPNPIVKMETLKRALRGSVRMLSGCLDRQSVVETSSATKPPGGAATAAFAEIVRRIENPTWLEIGLLLDTGVRQMKFMAQMAVTSSSQPLSNKDLLF